MILKLRSKGPTDLARCNQPVTENQSDRVAFADGLLYRAARIAGSPVIIRVGSLADDGLEFLISPAEDTPLPPKATVTAALRRKFSLDLDLPAFYRFVKRLPPLARLPARQAGLRPILKDTLLEALSLAIIDQQVNVAFAARLKHRLLNAYGRLYRVDGNELWLFPLAEELASLEPDALHPMQFSRSKSNYIVNLARRFLAEPYWESLNGTDEEIVERLCNLRGVGRWTAEYAAMMGLGLNDTLPAADIGLMRMVQQVYGLAERPTEDLVRKIGRDWSPWRGLVTFYLWHQEDAENAATATATIPNNKKLG
ncbi:MAG: DNA-3-methyladenine glycosylase 2 family protein [Fidelibacterota bacterium]|nr:MAG: DNA-3-methyladenine glycosylase 2 family protein [Candidatus Neomarinimicrobiota bacterium]